MMSYSEKDKKDNLITMYHEKIIGKTLYRVTSIYLGKYEINKILEDLIVKRVLRDERAIIEIE